MGTLGTGKRRRRDNEAGRTGRFDLNRDALRTQNLHTGSPVDPTTPVPPKQRKRTNSQWMQEDAHLARLFGGAALPLALLAQWAGAAMANAGRIHDPQAAIDLSATLVGRERLPCWTAEHPIRLEREILAGEATSFPGSSRGGWTIPRYQSR
jgi:hypothetical protein